MADPASSLALTGTLLAFALFAAGRGPGTAAASHDLGGAPPLIEVEVRQEGEPTRRVRAARGIVIGRAANAGIRLDDQTVSRLHARLERREDGIHVEDLGSRNGTLLNGKPLVREALLGSGDRVRIGSAEITFVGTGQWK